MARKQEEEQKPAPVAVPKSANVSPYEYGEDVGGGFGEMGAEQRVPILALLQDNSPQVKRASEKRVEGAEAGMIYNPATGKLYDGKAGIYFVPAHFARWVVDYRDRNQGGGFVAKHPWSREIMSAGKQKKRNIGTRLLPGGIERVYTRYLAGFLVESPGTWDPSEVVVLSFASSKMVPFQSWVNRVMQLKGPPPLWSHVLHLRSVATRNAAGQDFFNFVILPAVENDVTKSMLAPDHPTYQAGKQLDEQIKKGLVQVIFEGTDAGEEDDPEAAAAAGAGTDSEKAPF